MKTTIITDSKYLKKCLKVEELKIPQNTNYFLQVNCNIELSYINVPKSSKIIIMVEDEYNISFQDITGEGIITYQKFIPESLTELLGASEKFVAESTM